MGVTSSYRSDVERRRVSVGALDKGYFSITAKKKEIRVATKVTDCLAVQRPEMTLRSFGKEDRLGQE